MQTEPPEYDHYVVFNETDVSHESVCHRTHLMEDNQNAAKASGIKILFQHSADSSPTIGVSESMEFSATSDLIGIQAITTLNPVARLAIYKYLPATMLQTKI